MIEAWARCSQCDTVHEMIPHYRLPMPISAVIRWLEGARCPTCLSTLLVWEVDPHNAARRGDKVYWDELVLVRESGRSCDKPSDGSSQEEKKDE